MICFPSLASPLFQCTHLTSLFGLLVLNSSCPLKSADGSIKKGSGQTIPQTIEIRISGGYGTFFKAPQVILIHGRADLFCDLGQVRRLWASVSSTVP